MPKITVTFWTDAPVTEEGASAAAHAMVGAIGHGTVGESAYVTDVQVDSDADDPRVDRSTELEVEVPFVAPLDENGRAKSTTLDLPTDVTDRQRVAGAQEMLDAAKASAEITAEDGTAFEDDDGKANESVYKALSSSGPVTDPPTPNEVAAGGTPVAPDPATAPAPDAPVEGAPATENDKPPTTL